MAGIRIGCQTITWLSDPRWQEGIQDLLDQVAVAQYTGVETGPEVAHSYEHMTEEFEVMMAARGLSLAALFFATPLCDPARSALEVEEATRIAEFARSVGARILVIGGGLPQPGRSFVLDFRTMTETLNEIGSRCQRIGVSLAFHPYHGSLLGDRQQLSRFMDDTDAETVFLAPDIGHLVRMGCGYKEVLTTYYPRIRHIHLKDILANGAWTPLGFGLCDFQWIMRHLEDNGYEGWAVVDEESYLGDQTPLELVGLDRSFLRNIGY